MAIVLTEHLDYNVSANCVAQSASRAFGFLIAKCKLARGVPYNVFTKLYDAVVWPVVSYGAAVWGFKSFSSINAVHNRAMRYFLGVGKYTPNTELTGEMAWIPPTVRQWKTIALFRSRLSCSFQSRVNKRIALWANNKSGNTCKNCFFYVKTVFKLQFSTLWLFR